LDHGKTLLATGISGQVVVIGDRVLRDYIPNDDAKIPIVYAGEMGVFRGKKASLI
jgi:hypothetical protein